MRKPVRNERQRLEKIHEIFYDGNLDLRTGIEPRREFCQIEFANDDVGMPCGKSAVAKCSDCGRDSFCELCYDYHVTHSCVRKPVQNETKRHILGSHKAS